MRQSGSDPRSLQLNLNGPPTHPHALAGIGRRRAAETGFGAPECAFGLPTACGSHSVPGGRVRVGARGRFRARGPTRGGCRGSRHIRSQTTSSPSVRLNNRAFGGRQCAMDGARSATDVFRTRDTVHNSTISCTALPGHRANDGARAPFPSHLERLCREARLHEQRLELGLVLEEAHRPGRRLLPRR